MGCSIQFFLQMTPSLDIFDFDPTIICWAKPKPNSINEQKRRFHWLLDDVFSPTKVEKSETISIMNTGSKQAVRIK